MLTSLSLWFAGLVFVPCALRADEEIKKDKPEQMEKKEPAAKDKDEINQEKKSAPEKNSDEESAEEESKVLALSKQFNVPASVVAGLRAKKMGWGEISHLLVIAQKSGQSVETILKLRESGMGWGEIAHKYHLNLGEINSEVRAAKRAIAVERNEKTGRGTAERNFPKNEKPKFERPEKPGR